MIPIRFELHAHRGLPTEYPENSTVGLLEAAQCGAHYVELDLRFCQEKALVISHDESYSFDQVDLPIPSEQTTFEVHQKPLSFLKQVDTRRLRYRGDYSQPTFLPSFEEFLIQYSALGEAKAHLNIELKTHEAFEVAEYSRAILTLLDRFRLGNAVQIQSFDKSLMRHLRQQNAPFRLGWLSEVHEAPEQLEESFEDLKPDLYVVRGDILSPESVETAKKQGIGILVWTLNEDAHFEKAYAGGVHGIITDQARLLKQWAQGKGLDSN